MNSVLNTTNRPPIVTIMGHVDHGKTTLLDAIRKTNVVAREHGGITQHIGAYQVEQDSKLITFIDTPGHAAFEKMRSRGADVSDIVILVVAANDSVKPQTIEAIKHIKRAQKPIIVAITKVDLPNLNIEKVKGELQREGVTVEGYGGDIPVVEVAATKNQGIKELLEVINLVWDLNPQPSLQNNPLQAIVVESFLDKNRGPIVTVIVKEGTLSVGQKIIVDAETINVKALIDDNGTQVKEALPSKPVEILGFKKILEVGTIIADQNQSAPTVQKGPASFADIVKKSETQKNKFKVVIKADVAGSLEAILENLPPNVLVISATSGEITDSDIAFAKTANAPIIAFGLKVSNSTLAQAQRDGIFIKSYDVIYKLLEDIEDVVAGFEQAKMQAKIIGKAKIIAAFAIEGKKIAGVKVASGKITVNDQIILVRGDSELGDAKIASIRKFKKEVSSASTGQECGIAIEPQLEFQEGDVIESYGH